MLQLFNSKVVDSELKFQKYCVVIFLEASRLGSIPNGVIDLLMLPFCFYRLSLINIAERDDFCCW